MKCFRRTKKKMVKKKWNETLKFETAFIRYYKDDPVNKKGINHATLKIIIDADDPGI